MEDESNMMNENNGGEEPPSKKSRSEGGKKIEARVLIQSKNAGAIIGKGGSNISRLRSEYKASVTVPDCPGPERVLTIMADVDTVCDVLLDVIPKLNDDREGDTELRMLVHQSQVGCIIGRAGFKIQELREQTGASIKVYSQCCPNSTERIVQVTGKPKVIIDCIQKVCDLLIESPVKGMNHPYDPHNFDDYYSNEYGGYGDAGGRDRRMGGGGPMRGGGFRGGSRMGPPQGGRMGGGGGGSGGMRGGFGGRDMDRRSSGGGMMRSRNDRDGGFR